MLIVTLPEATPVHEAASLQRDLKRAGIAPFAWVINQSLAPLSLTDPMLRVAAVPRAALHPRGRRGARPCGMALVAVAGGRRKAGRSSGAGSSSGPLAEAVV